MGTATDNKRRTIALLVIAAALAAVAGNLWYGRYFASPETPTATPSRPAVEWLARDRAGSQAPPRAENSEKIEAGIEDPRPDDDRRYVRFVFFADEGSHVGAMRFRLMLRRPHFSEEWAEHQTDTHGIAEALIDKRFVQWKVVVIDEDWEANEQGDTFSAMREELRMRVQPLWKIHVTAYFDDGEPYLGHVGVSNDAGKVFPDNPADPRGERIQRQPTPDSPTRTIARIRPGRDVELAFNAKFRPGYDPYYKLIPAAEVFNGAVFQVTIPRAQKPKGNLIVDLRNLPQRHDSRPSIEIRKIDDNRRVLRQLVSVTPAGKFHNEGMSVGAYRVMVFFDDQVSRDIVEIRDREETVITPVFATGASVSVIVLDESGKPLRDAVLYTPVNFYWAWPVDAAQGAVAVSDHKGRAELSPLHPDQRMLRIEAQGYDPVEVPVSLAPGKKTDLGQVSLTPARGCITVRLLNCREGKQYDVQHCAPGVGGPGSWRNMVKTWGDDVVFAGLPLRKYSVFVTYTGGGTTAGGLVELTAESPNMVFEIDVGNLPENEPVPSSAK
ncbi:MAG: carboxypeptidase regulatory-like domain-containing protein [Planctomycetes bacterium]|nr:carboxypeptidase regulatory-like domain-containing protein [Planctomycetota bacterium]MCW8137272.1 carboxypeptidase regulatory-like domain-containing protein [Planctomycetota bacterium]